jgi:hypothetical protein
MPSCVTTPGQQIRALYLVLCTSGYWYFVNAQPSKALNVIAMIVRDLFWQRGDWSELVFSTYHIYQP